MNSRTGTVIGGVEPEATPTQLVAQGVADVAPVASHDAEDGHARNRRFELVKQ